MTQAELFNPIKSTKFDSFSKSEIINLFEGEQELRIKLQKENERLRSLNPEFKQKSFLVNEQYVLLKSKVFGKSSEREPQQETKIKSKKSRIPKKKVQLPSQRYPNATVIEKDIEFKELPPVLVAGSR